MSDLTSTLLICGGRSGGTYSSASEPSREIPRCRLAAGGARHVCELSPRWRPRCWRAGRSICACSRNCRDRLRFRGRCARHGVCHRLVAAVDRGGDLFHRLHAAVNEHAQTRFYACFAASIAARTAQCWQRSERRTGSATVQVPALLRGSQIAAATAAARCPWGDPGSTTSTRRDPLVSAPIALSAGFIEIVDQLRQRRPAAVRDRPRQGLLGDQFRRKAWPPPGLPSTLAKFRSACSVCAPSSPYSRIEMLRANAEPMPRSTATPYSR